MLDLTIAPAAHSAPADDGASGTSRQASASRKARLASAAALTATLALLTACGGSGGGSDNGGSTPNNPAPPPPAPVSTTTLSGTAATGAAMAGATVRVKCVAGTGTATANATGSYTIEVAAATLPCVASATSSDGATVLHSLVSPTGGSTQTININPVTELLVARVAGAAPASFFSGFDAAAAARTTAASIDAAVAHVVATLREGGVDFTTFGNPITAALVAATATTAGNAYDQALDALAARLRTAGTTLPQLVAQVVVQALAGTTPAASANPAVGLPPELLLRAAHASCAALRSGSYRVIKPMETSMTAAASLIRLDAPTLTFTFDNGDTGTFTATGNCTFSADSERLRMVVSQAGVGVWTAFNPNANQQQLWLSFPEQPANLAALAATWNTLTFKNAQSAQPTAQWQNWFAVNELSADGRVLSSQECPALLPCFPQGSALPTLRVNTQGGGFDVLGDTRTQRAFMFKPASGDPMLVVVEANRDLKILTPRRAFALRTLGETWSFWGLSMGVTGLTSTTFSDASYIASAVDTVAQTYTRRNVANGQTVLLSANKPREGLIYLNPGTTTLNDGTVVTIFEGIVLPLPGTGVVVSGNVTDESTRARGSLGFSVGKP